MSEPLYVALIGTGYWGKNYVRILEELRVATDKVKLLCICDLDIKILESFREKYPEVNYCQDVEKMLQDFPQIEACMVVTPATTHFRIINTCLNYGKHILVEKPITVDYAEGEKLVELASEKKKLLMVGHTFLFNKGVQKLREMVSNQDDLGKLYYITATRTGLGPIRKDADAVWDLVPHDIAILQYIMNNQKPIMVNAVGSSFLYDKVATQSGNIMKMNRSIDPHGTGFADAAFITITYPNNVVANIHVSWANQDRKRQFVVVGSKERIEFNDTEAVNKIKVNPNGIWVQKNENGVEEIKVESSKPNQDVPFQPFEPLKDQISYFIDSVRNKESDVISNGDMGVTVTKIMTAISRSILLHGAPIFNFDL